MAALSDSSGSLPLTDDAIEQQPQHRDLIVSVELRRSIALVARRQGVSDADEHDVVQETLARTLRMRLPDDRDEARKYIHGIAKRVALETKRGAARGSDEEYVEDAPDSDGALHGASASAQPAAIDERDVARKVADAAHTRFPTSFSYFLQARLLGRSPDQIANDHDVHPGHVRHEIAAMQRFVSDYGAKLGASVAVLLLLCGGYAWWSARNPGRDWATLQEVRRTEPPPLDRDAQVDRLRARALRACEEGEFQACLDDTDAADALDPIGAQSWKSLRKQALEQLTRQELTPVPVPAPSPLDWKGPEGKGPSRGQGR